MKILDVQNIKIPSVNGKYSVNHNTGRLYLSKKYRAFKDLMETLIVQFAIDTKIDPPYSLRINVSTAVDIDNFLKPLIDSLQQARLIDDDKNILRLIIEKKPVKRGELGSLQVFLNTLNDEV